MNMDFWWLGISDFANFQSRHLSGSDLPASVTKTPRKAGATKVALFDAKLFKKGMKRDSDAYLILKNEKSFNTWIRGIKAEMAAQGVTNIYDTSYIEPQILKS